MNSLGKLAELKACEYLKRKRYKLIDANYSTRFGEIDLIMTKGKYICFIEVKMRNQNSIAAPVEFVDYRKQKKIIASAEIFLAGTAIDLQPRFDIIEVYTENNNIKCIKHLENAFELY